MGDYYTHYYSVTQNMADLISFAENAVNNLTEVIKPALIYSGMSGTTLATALASEYFRELNKTPLMIYVRKPDENKRISNPRSGKIETNSIEDFITQPHNFHWFFIDDTIDSGKTLEHCINTLNGILDTRKPIKSSLDFAIQYASGIDSNSKSETMRRRKPFFSKKSNAFRLSRSNINTILYDSVCW